MPLTPPLEVTKFDSEFESLIPKVKGLPGKIGYVADLSEILQCTPGIFSVEIFTEGKIEGWRLIARVKTILPTLLTYEEVKEGSPNKPVAIEYYDWERIEHSSVKENIYWRALKPLPSEEE